MTYKMARRIVVFVVGATVVIVGIVMIVTPGPAFVVIPVGLAILSIEFAWARLWLKHIRERISDGSSRLRGRKADERKRDAESGAPLDDKKTGAGE
jgi:tellurite resistance protein TerC